MLVILGVGSNEKSLCFYGPLEVQALIALKQSGT